MLTAFLDESNDICLHCTYVCSIQLRVAYSAQRKKEMNSHSHMQCCMQQPSNTSRAPTHHLNSMTSGTCHLLHIRYHWEWYMHCAKLYTQLSYKTCIDSICM